MVVHNSAIVGRWDVLELSFQGPSDGNPFVEVKLSVEFRLGGRGVKVPAFYDGLGVYRVRFLADQEGVWDYTTTSSTTMLSGLTGSFHVAPARPGRHGPVRVSGQYHFAHEDGTRFVPVGTTCYVWNLQDENLENLTLKTLRTSPFNKMRMCVFPKNYDYNHNEPKNYPFEGSVAEGWDWSRPNPEYFRHLECRIFDLDSLGIECDLILFHPYDRWGFSSMGQATDDLYLNYLIARLSAYPNLWWSLCNEFDLMASKTEADWERFGRTLQEKDPWGHLRSIHNCVRFYDHTRPWITHASVQRIDVYKTSENTNQWRDWWRKPVVVDECGYEGDINWGWGNLSGEEMVRRFWEGSVRGGYVGHGETYRNEREELWWSKGGRLVGSSPSRIAFLRTIIEDCPGPGMSPISIGPSYWDLPVGGVVGEYYLFYFGNCQIGFRELDLPEDRSFHVEIIDTWNMTMDRLEGTRSGRFRVELPSQPFMALRARLAKD